MKYDRQILCLGEEAQTKFKDATVALIGVGGLGAFTADLLARAGVGKLMLFDKDNVEDHNLHRQILYDEHDVGQPKVLVAKKKLEIINSQVVVEAYQDIIHAGNIDLLQKADILLDGTDNLPARFMLNEWCLKHNKPWIHAAGAGERGRCLFIDPQKICLSCLYKEGVVPDSPATLGILNTLVTVAGSIQVSLTLKFLMGEEIPTELITFDVWNFTTHRLKVHKDKNCKVCSI